jgi:magnesium-transporting ATPase (P-type)
MIVLYENDQIPCDVVILKTSEETGSCYIQTANLDGETDFKSRRAVPETMNLTEAELASFHGIIECAAPNPEIYKFDSLLRMSSLNDRRTGPVNPHRRHGPPSHPPVASQKFRSTILRQHFKQL